MVLRLLWTVRLMVACRRVGSDLLDVFANSKHRESQHRVPVLCSSPGRRAGSLNTELCPLVTVQVNIDDALNRQRYRLQEMMPQISRRTAPALAVVLVCIGLVVFALTLNHSSWKQNWPRAAEW